MQILINEIDKAKDSVDGETANYLSNIKKVVENVMTRLQNNELPQSNGGLIGTMRAISEYDNLSCIQGLYDAASDVDIYYSKECKEW